MEIIGIVGLPGSGKTEISNYARGKDIPVISMGDVVRRECLDRGLEPGDYHGEIAKKLREELGRGVIAKLTIPLVHGAMGKGNRVVIDGIRSGYEVEAFREEFGKKFKLLKIESPFELRFERIGERGRDNPEVETLKQRDDRELGFGLRDAMESADVGIKNVGTIGELYLEISKLIG